MTESILERVSAVVDGEASEFELHQVIRAVQEDADIRAAFIAQQRVSTLSQHPETAAWVGFDISKAVASAIAVETVPLMKSASASGVKSSWRSVLQGAAIAASVAAVTVVGYQSLSLFGQGGGSVSVAASPVRVPVSQYSSVVSYGNKTVPVQAPLAPQSATADEIAERERLQSYLLQHTEQSGAYPAQGVMPMAKIVSFEVDE